jgi:hypothetical protein
MQYVTYAGSARRVILAVRENAVDNEQEVRNLDLHRLTTLLQRVPDGGEECSERSEPHLSLQVRRALLWRLIDFFREPAPEGQAFAFGYYSEIALLIRNIDQQGVRFLYDEQPQADTQRLRAILFALAEPPKLRRSWLPQLWWSYLDDERPEVVAEAIDSLWRYGDKKAKYRVLQLQHHRSEYVRGSVLRYISHIVPRFAPLLLVAALGDDHFIVRETAIDELDRLEVVESLPYLYPYLADDHAQVRQAAVTAVENLTSAAKYRATDQRQVG